MKEYTFPIILTSETDNAVNIVITNVENVENAIMYYYGGDKVEKVEEVDEYDLPNVVFRVSSHDGAEWMEHSFWVESGVKIF